MRIGENMHPRFNSNAVRHDLIRSRPLHLKDVEFVVIQAEIAWNSEGTRSSAKSMGRNFSKPLDVDALFQWRSTPQGQGFWEQVNARYIKTARSLLNKEEEHASSP